MFSVCSSFKSPCGGLCSPFCGILPFRWLFPTYLLITTVNSANNGYHLGSYHKLIPGTSL